jgi:hypothetical protein
VRDRRGKGGTGPARLSQRSVHSAGTPVAAASGESGGAATAVAERPSGAAPRKNTGGSKSKSKPKSKGGRPSGKRRR